MNYFNWIRCLRIQELKDKYIRARIRVNYKRSLASKCGKLDAGKDIRICWEIQWNNWQNYFKVYQNLSIASRQSFSQIFPFDNHFVFLVGGRREAVCNQQNMFFEKSYSTQSLLEVSIHLQKIVVVNHLLKCYSSFQCFKIWGLKFGRAISGFLLWQFCIANVAALVSFSS